jgi:hypothetical protein
VPIISVSRPIALIAQEIAIIGVTWKGLRRAVSVRGASAGMMVDIRTKAGNPATSLAAAKLLEADVASLLVEDDDRLSAAAFVVVLGADGTLLAQTQTTVGG